MKRLVFIFSLFLLIGLYGCSYSVPEDDSLRLSEEEEKIFVEEIATEKEEEEFSTKKTYVRSKVDSLSVRTAPNTSSKKLGYLDAGDMVALYGREEEWYKTYYRGREAYISAKSVYTETVDMDVADERTETVIALGEKLLGTPYVYGATRLHDGYGNMIKGFTVNEFDCSSYMQYIFYYGADIILHSTTRTQVSQGTEVERGNIKRGDLIFMTNSSRKNNTGIERIGHVALYLGDNYILHTASDHAVIEQMTAARWENYITARRMI